MKKKALLGLSAFLALGLVACQGGVAPTTTQTATPTTTTTVTPTQSATGSQTSTAADEEEPEISGVHDLTTTVGETINLLQGVTATDDVDGDLTSSITVTTLPELTVTNGSVTPTEQGDYEVQYKVVDAAGNEGEAFCTLTVNPHLAEKELYIDYSFGNSENIPFSLWKFDGLTGESRINKGNYEITGTTDNEAWHVKFEGNVKTVAGADYELTYKFNSNVAGKVKFEAYNVTTSGEKNVVVGANTLSFKFTASEAKDNQGFCLQLGMLPTNYKLEFSQIEIKETIGKDVWKVVNKDFAFDGQNVVKSDFGDGSQGSVVTAADKATMTITRGSNGNNVWETKLFVKAGVDLAKDKKYRITVDFKAEKAINAFEVCYNNGDAEKGVGALYGQKAEAGVKKTIEYIVTPDAAKDNLTLQFQLGAQNVKGEGNVIEVSNLKVEQIVLEDETVVENHTFASSNMLSHFWSDSQGSFVPSNEGSSALLNVTKGTTTPNVWEIRAFMGLGAGVEKGRTYKVSVDILSNVDVSKFEAALGKFQDTDPAGNGIYNQTLTANETKHLEFETLITDNIANAGLTISIGSIQTAAQVQFSNLEVVALGGSKEENVDSYVFTPEGFGTYNNADEGAEGYLYIENGKLVYEMTSIALVDWHNKMYIETLHLEADKIYTIEIVAKADKAISCAFFVAVKGGAWDPRVSQQMDFTTEDKTFEFVTPKFAADLDFEVLFQFGSAENAALENAKIEISSIKIYSQEVE